MSLTQGRSNSGQTQVNSLELTRGSSPAEPETAEGVGFALLVTKGAAEGFYETPRLARIHSGQRQQLGCSTAMAAMASEAAKATAAQREGCCALASECRSAVGSRALQEDSRCMGSSARRRQCHSRRPWRAAALGLAGTMAMA